MQSGDSHAATAVVLNDTRPLVVQIVRQYAPSRGGLEDVVANLCKSLPGHGYRVRVVTCDRLFTAPDITLPSREMIDGIEVVRIPWSGSSRYPLAPQVFRHIRDADLIHVHAIDFFFDALAWGRMLHRKPMVATTHGGFFHTPKYAAIKKAWFKTVTRFSASAYRFLICCSGADLALFSQIASSRAVLIENGVDATKFAGVVEGPPEKRIVTIGRFSVNKRIDRLLDTMAELVRRDDEWRLDVIGAPSDLGEADLKDAVTQRRLGNHVSLHISPENDRIRALIGEASLFASASEYEGFGLVAVEAMGAGLVPVLHRNEAYRTLAERHDGIVLADFSNAKESAARLVAAYEGLVADPEGCRAAMMAAAKIYSWDQVSARYAEVYSAALAGNALRPARSSS